MVGSSFKLETYPSPPRWKETHPCPPCIGRELDIGVRFSLALINSLVHIIHIRINFPVFVYDVKYKYFNSIYGVKREDLFQLHTYVAYLSNFYTIKSCGFIYPQEEGRCNDTENVIKIHEIDIPFFIRFFNIPENKDFQFCTLKYFLKELGL